MSPDAMDRSITLPPMRLELPGLLLRSCAAVLVLWTVVALGIASWRADREIREEMQAAMTLVEVLATVGAQVDAAQGREDEAVIADISAALAGRSVRHVALTLRDEQGRRLWGVREADTGPAWMRHLVDVLRTWQVLQDPPPVLQTLQRAQGREWTLVISPSPDSERRQAITVMFRQFGMLVLALGFTLLLMRWQLMRHLEPLRRLLDTIGVLRAGRWTATTAPERMPLAEWEAVRSALQSLGEALAQAEADRRTLAQRLQSLQEDERARLARDLHDELGQRLTALRLDAALVQRSLPSEGAALKDMVPLGQQVQAAQDAVRRLIRELAPRSDEWTSPEDLRRLLASVIQTRPELSGDCSVALGTQPLPRSVALALFRMTQEAWTNALRHAKASQVEIRLRREGDRVIWSFSDDGIGISEWSSALYRGNGLLGMRERAWAFGGDLAPMPSARGLHLQAWVNLHDA